MPLLSPNVRTRPLTLSSTEHNHPSRPRPWGPDELDVLVAAFFANEFAAGDDARPECRRLADAFGRSPSAVDRQWRNVNDVCGGKAVLKVGRRVREAVHSHLADPVTARSYALRICT